MEGTNVGGSFEDAWRQIKGGITRAALSVMGEWILMIVSLVQRPHLPPPLSDDSCWNLWGSHNKWPGPPQHSPFSKTVWLCISDSLIQLHGGSRETHVLRKPSKERPLGQISELQMISVRSDWNYTASYSSENRTFEGATWKCSFTDFRKVSFGFFSVHQEWKTMSQARAGTRFVLVKFARGEFFHL